MNTSSARPVVVGVNESPASLNAVRAAARQAMMYGRELRIIHVCNWLPTYQICPRRTADALMDRAAAMADDVAPGLRITTRMLEGAPATLLLRESRTAALIVVGDGSLSASACPIVDGCAAQLAGRAWCNVMVTRPIQHDDGPVVVGVDGSSRSGRLLDVGFDAAMRRGTEVIAVHAWTPEEPDELVEAQSRLLRAAISAREMSYAVTVRSLLVRGEPTDILRRESQRAGLMVVGTRDERPYGGMPGSVTQALLRRCSSPLVVVRGQSMVTPPAARRPEPVGETARGADGHRTGFPYTGNQEHARP